MEERRFSFDTRLDRANTNSIKWDRAQGRLPFGIADMDFPSFPQMREAMVNRCINGTFGYTEESEAFFDSVVSWFARRHSLELKPEEILTVSGTLESLSYLLHTFFKKGDTIVLSIPVYHPFHTTLGYFGINVGYTPLLLQNGRYYMDFDAIEEQFKNGAKGILLCNPHNPCGRAWTKEELHRLVDLCLEYQAMILSDEIHIDFCYPHAEGSSILSAHPRAKECSIVMTAPSKTFNTPGLKCSLLFVQNADMREKIEQTLRNFHNDINILGLLATEVAYREGDEWVDALVAYLWDNVLFVEEYLREHLPTVKMIRPDATYLLWLDFSGYGFEQDELMRIISDEARLVVGNGTVSGENGEGFIRMNIGTTREMVRAGLEALNAAFSKYEHR